MIRVDDNVIEFNGPSNTLCDELVGMIHALYCEFCKNYDEALTRHNFEIIFQSATTSSDPDSDPYDVMEKIIMAERGEIN